MIPLHLFGLYCLSEYRVELHCSCGHTVELHCSCGHRVELHCSCGNRVELHCSGCLPGLQGHWSLTGLHCPGKIGLHIA